MLTAEDMTTSLQKSPTSQDGSSSMPHVAGLNSILPKEHGAKFYTLPVVKNPADKHVRISYTSLYCLMLLAAVLLHQAQSTSTAVEFGKKM